MFLFFLAPFIQEKSNDLVGQENIELMPMPLTSTENSNAAAILISSERIGEDDNEEDDFPDQEEMNLLPMPSTSQGNSNDFAILISIENTDDNDADDDDDDDDDYDGDDDDNDDDDYDREDERKSSGFLVQANAEVLQMPSTSQRNSNAPVILKSSETNDNVEEEEEADSFTTQKLFSFAWQIAKGMVSICIAISK